MLENYFLRALDSNSFRRISATAGRIVIPPCEEIVFEGSPNLAYVEYSRAGKRLI
jgi:hypothetical protein